MDAVEHVRKAEETAEEGEGEEGEEGADVPVAEPGVICEGVVQRPEYQEVQSEDGYGVGANP